MSDTTTVRVDRIVQHDFAVECKKRGTTVQAAATEALIDKMVAWADEDEWRADLPSTPPPSAYVR